MKGFACIAALAAAALLSSSAFSAEGRFGDDSRWTTARLGKEESLPSCGLRLRVFKDMESRPVPAIAATHSKDASGARVEAYNVNELWFRDQCVGYFLGPSGALFVLQMLRKPPTDVGNVAAGLTTRELFEKWKSREASRFSAKDDTKAWLDAVARDVPLAPRAASVKPPPNVDISSFCMGGVASVDVFVVANQRREDQRFALIYVYGGEMERSHRAVLNSVESIAFFTPKSVSPEASKKFSGARREINYSEEYLASRQKVLDNIKNLAGWWYDETENYLIVSDLKERGQIKDVRESVERCRKSYQMIYPLVKPISAVSVVKVFEKQEDYALYLGGRAGLVSIGVWSDPTKELLISPCEYIKGRRRKDEVVKVIYHEGFHQFIHYATGELRTSLWFNEGNATMFEGLSFRTLGKCDVDVVDKYWGYLKERQARERISELVRMSPERFMNSDPMMNYSLSWALMYFLFKGAPAMDRAAYSEIPGRYYMSAIETGDPDAATEAAWRGVDMSQFEKDFDAFWANSQLITKSKRVEMKPVMQAPMDESSQGSLLNRPNME